jgi:hypothetical protein
MAGIMSMMH